MSARDDGTAPQSAEALREEIDRTRDELAETVDALAARADVKARLHGTAEAAKARVAAKADTARSVVMDDPPRTALIAGTGLVVGAVAFLIWRRFR